MVFRSLLVMKNIHDKKKKEMKMMIKRNIVPEVIKRDRDPLRDLQKEIEIAEAKEREKYGRLLMFEGYYHPDRK